MIPTPPFVLLLKAGLQSLAAIDYEALTGVAGVKVRHRRNRYSRAAEEPCVALAIVEDVVPDDAALDLNAWEKVRQLTLDIIVDMALDPEDSNQDETGLEKLGLVGMASFEALRDPNSPFGQLVDFVSLRDIAPSEDSKADKGRLSLTSIVLYRVRSDDENVLLAEGVNG